MSPVTPAQFTTVCQQIFGVAAAQLPMASRSRLKHDPLAKVNLPGQKALKFCIWLKGPGGIWNRNYASYHLLLNPFKELTPEHDGLNHLFHVRFMFFTKRKETGLGKFNREVEAVLDSAKPRLSEFKRVTSDRLFNLYRGTDQVTLEDWSKTAGSDLARLMTETLPGLDSIH
jgi:hypothetical protein